MARSIWKGSISFGLVQVPVSVYPAEQRQELHLSMLDSRDYSPVGYKRVNKNTGEEVEWETIVKGYEYEKGEYVLLSDEDLKRANVEATQTVEIVDFVDASQIPLEFFDTPYFLEPLKRGEKGYALLRETLKRTGKVGIAKVVLRTRQHLAALIPEGEMLILELLRYRYELRERAEIKLPSADLKALGIGDKEVEMAERLVQGMVEKWEPERYHDEYRDDLMRLIDEKVKAGQTHVLTPPSAEEEGPRGAEVIDLMAQLKRSLERTERERGKPAAQEVPSGGRRRRGPEKGGEKKGRKRA